MIKNKEMPPPVAIIGAGPAGLTLARLLEMYQIDYIVFDRDLSGNQAGQGGTLDIHDDSGQIALKEAGLLEEFEKAARYDDQIYKILNSQGEKLFRGGDSSIGGRPEIDRGVLRQILLNSVPPEKIRWNSRVQEVIKKDDGSTAIHFMDGTTETGFKLIVGADGAWSKVRPLLTCAKPEYSGLCYIQTSISPANPMYASFKAQADRGTCMVLAGGKELISQHMNGGIYNIYAGLHLSEEWIQNRDRSDPEAFTKRCLELIEKEYSEWSPEVTRWAKQSDGIFHAWPLYAMPVESLSWQPVPGITVVGDAAHVSTPFIGEGVNCSIYDSLQLAQCLKKFGLESLDEAVAEYEKMMMPRAITMITESKENGDRLFAQNAAEQIIEWFGRMANAE